MPDSVAVCLFCSRGDLPLTREHVFAHWLIVKTHGARLVASHGADDGPRLSRIVVTVCAPCNAGWMSGLEVSFRRLVFAPARVGPLAAVDRIALARWFTKTAALLARAHDVTLVAPNALPALRTGMPDHVEVYLARRRRARQPLDYAFHGDDDPIRAVAISVGDLVAHVVCGGTLEGRRGIRLWPLRTHALRWDTLPVIGAATTTAR